MLQTLYRTVATSGTVSSIFALQDAKVEALFAFVPTSCVAYLQVSHNEVDFTRAFKVDGSAQWAWNIGSGAAAVDLKDVGRAFPFARLETSVAQVAVASLAVVVKL